MTCLYRSRVQSRVYELLRILLLGASGAQARNSSCLWHRQELNDSWQLCYFSQLRQFSAQEICCVIGSQCWLLSDPLLAWSSSRSPEPFSLNFLLCVVVWLLPIWLGRLGYKLLRGHRAQWEFFQDFLSKPEGPQKELSNQAEIL